MMKWEQSMSASETVKKIRITLCLEQTEFAEKLGVTAAAVCNYERGTRIPRFPIIKKMRKLAHENGLDFSVEEFLDNDKENE